VAISDELASNGRRESVVAAPVMDPPSRAIELICHASLQYLQQQQQQQQQQTLIDTIILCYCLLTDGLP
jgi:hypothetical protein